MPDNAIYDYKDKRDAINALYSLMNDKIDEADVTHIVSRVQNVVNESIESLNILMEQAEGYGQKIDLSGLDFKKIEEEFLKIEGNKNIAVQSLKDRVAKKMNRLLDQNPIRIDFYERYQEIIENYNNGKEYATVKELFDALILLLGDLSEEEKTVYTDCISLLNQNIGSTVASFGGFSISALEKDKAIIIPRAMYSTTPDTFEQDIKRLEQLYTPKVIVKYLKNTKENISNKVCVSVAKRYKVEPFLRYSL
jgi:hypothetical protein